MATVQSSRDHIKSILRCLDERDYESVSKKLEVISVDPSTQELHLFLEGLVFLAKNQRQRGGEQFNILLLRLDERTERSSVVEKYAVLLTLAMYSLSAGDPVKINKAMERFLRPAEREMFEQLMSNPVIAYDPEHHELQATLHILFRVWRATGQGSISLTELSETNLIQRVELTHSGQSAFAAFENFTGHEDGVEILVRLGNCALVRELSYEYLLNAFGAFCLTSDSENRQRAIELLGQMVHNIEHTESSSGHVAWGGVAWVPQYTQSPISATASSRSISLGVVYRWVTATDECPSSAATFSRPTPALIRFLAKECRSICGVAATSARRPSSWMRSCTPRDLRGVRSLPTNTWRCSVSGRMSVQALSALIT